jgi:hypothetical protein
LSWKGASGWIPHAFLLLTALSLPTCLVSEPPAYVAPEFERPNLLLLDADPPITQVKSVERGDRVTFRVPIETIPATEPIRWQLWANFDLQNESWLAQNIVREGDAEIVGEWTVPTYFEPGCLQVTLLAAHDSSLGTDIRPDAKPEIIQRSDVATATWWFAVDAPLGGQLTLANCQTKLEPPQ